MVHDDNEELTRFAVEQFVPMARALKKKYYKLHG